jgi:orotidine-5'-phosphate decarboxylase
VNAPPPSRQGCGAAGPPAQRDGAAGPVLVALDVGSSAEALALADKLRGTVGGFKIGKQLFTAEGPAIVRALADRGDRVFLDLKFHDIPNTVAGAVSSAIATGAWMIDVHASGGRAMMQAAAAAATATATRLGRPRPLVVGVTVLTSLDEAALRETGVGVPPRDHVVKLATLAQAAGLDGVVASPLEIADIRRACGDRFAIVTPGIRRETRRSPIDGRQGVGGRQDDQVRTLGPREALETGAHYLVIGRPITGAPDPLAAAQEIAAEIALAERSNAAG